MRLTIQEILAALRRKEISKEEAFLQIKEIQKKESQKVFIKEFEYDEPYLRAHIIFGKQVLLGVTNCSIALESCYEQYGSEAESIHIHKMVFQKALVMENGKASITVKTVEKEQKIYFENVAQKSLEQPFITATGEIITGEMPEETFQFEQFVKCAEHVIAKERLEANKMLLRTKELKAVEEVYAAGNEAAGVVHVTDDIILAAGDYAVSPAVLDSGFIIAAAALSDDILCPDEGNGMWIPFMMKDIYLKGRLPRKVFCKARFIRNTKDLLVLEFSMFDKDGNAVLIVKEFTFKFSSQNTAVSEKNSEPVNLSESIKQFLVKMVADELETDVSQIKRNENFMEMGIESNSLIHLSSSLEEELKVELYPTIFFEYQTIQELSKFLEDNYKNELHEYFKEEDTAVKPEVRSQLTPLEITKPSEEKEVTIQTVKAEEERDDIAIIGMAAKFPMADTLDEFWKNLETSKDMITEIPKDHWNVDEWFEEEPSVPDKTYSKWGSFIEPDKFDPRFFGITPREAEWMDPQLRILLEKTQDCIEDAGYGKRINGTNTGLFLATSFHEYWDQIMREHTPIVDYQAVNSVASALAGRLSFLYDLHGISIPIDNACASSLTAIHLAKNALLSGECDMAFVAGVNMLLSPIHYVFTSKAKALSPTGHCYPFDEKANGYVPGEGVAVLLLKPLKKAIADRDNIHAVIKGSAVNHVGRANNPTSPRPELQIKMLKEAWKDAGVSPESISYIETHGTGTKLGDPIEFNSLKTAFGEASGKRQFCALGSAKAHLGHLEAAAGLVGVIKTVLSMQHKEIPAMPYFKKLNPLISLDDTPFYINDSLAEWKSSDDKPRRAGISAFGMAGHNAHVILEEYKKPHIRRDIRKEKQIVLFSAKNEERLLDYADLFIRYLEKRKEAGMEEDILPVIAYSLMMGREEMEERLLILAESEEELLDRLYQFKKQQKNSEGIFYGRIDSSKMDQEKVMDISVEQFLAKDDLASLAGCWVQGEYIDWEKYWKDERPEMISLPTYPFAKEHYWRSENQVAKEPDKGKTEVLHPLLDANLSTFEEQVYYKKFTSKDFCIQEHQVSQKKVLPGVAYLEMARKAAELAMAKKQKHTVSIQNMVWVKTAVLKQNELPVYLYLYPEDEGIGFEFEGSSRERYAQGKLMVLAQEEELRTIDMELIHSRCGVVLDCQNYYQKYRELGLVYGNSYQVMKELKGNEEEALAKLELPECRKADLQDFLLHPCLMDGALQTVTGIQNKEQMNQLYLPFSIGKLTIFGGIPACCYVHAVMANKTGNNKTFRIEIVDESGNVLVIIEDFLMRAIDTEQTGQVTKSYLYRKAEVEKEIGINQTNINEDSIFVLGTKEQLKSGMVSDYKNAVFVESGSDFANVLNSLEQIPDTILYLWADKEENSYQDAVEEQLVKSLYSVSSILQQLLKKMKDQSLQFVFVYAKDQTLSCYGAMEAFFKSVQYEHAQLQWKMIGVDSQQLKNPNASFRSLLKAEIHEVSDSCQHIYYKNGKRFTTELRTVESNPRSGLSDMLKENATYLIAGGSGKLGKQLADYLLSKKKSNLILIGRREKPEWVNAYSQITYLRTDIADREAFEQAFKRVKEIHPAINGIFQCAGINKDCAFLEKEKDTLEAVIRPKVQGTVNLDEVTGCEPLDFFIMYSSLAGITGNMGQCDYSFANNFLDEFAKNRAVSRKPGKTLVIHWPFWKDGGMRISQASEKMMVNTLGIQALETEQGMELLEKVSGLREESCIPLTGDIKKFEKVLFPTSEKPVKKEIQEMEQTGQTGQEDKLDHYVKQAMIADVSSILKISEKDVDIYEEMNEFGFDSITFTEFSNLLNDKYNMDIIPSVFFEHTTLASFIEYTIEEYKEQLLAYFKLTDATEKTEPEQKQYAVEAESLSRHKKKLNRRMKELTPVMESRPEKQQMSMASEDIAIVGMSGVMPNSENLEEFYENLIAGKNMISEIPPDRWDYRKYYGDPLTEKNKTNVKWAGFMKDVDKFDPAFFGISPLEAELMDPQQRIFLETTWNTIEDAGYSASELSGSSTGVFVGVGGLDYMELIRQSDAGIQAHSSTGISHCLLPNRVSFFFNFHGPSEPVNTACSSSLVAIHNAVRSIQRGECDQAIAGGINVIASPSTFISFSKAGMLSPDGECKTFDKDANGYVRGEGSGAVMLKRLSQAEKDGDHIYAVVKGSAVNHGGRAASLTAPNTTAQSDLIVTAWKDAGLDPSTATYIEAHGTGTSLGDPVEVNGLKKAFARLYADSGKSMVSHRCGIGSVKSNIGHLETAAGIASVLKVVLAMKNGMIPKTIHFHERNPYINLENSPFYIMEETCDWTRLQSENGCLVPRRAGISSFGFGGVNAHLVLEEYLPEKETEQDCCQEEAGEEELILLSAKTKGQLKEEAKRLKAFLLKHKVENDSTSSRIPQKIKTKIKEIAADLCSVEVEDISEEDELSEIGMGQIEKTELMNHVNMQFGTDADIMLIEEALTVEQVISKVSAVLIAEGLCIQDEASAENDQKSASYGVLLKDIAYTLQCGREAMEERLVILCRSVGELEAYLTQYLEGKENASCVFSGNAKKNKEFQELICGGREGEAFLKLILEEKHYSRLSKLWVMGVNVDWKELYQNTGRKRIALPGYPFLRERYWVEAQEENQNQVVEAVQITTKAETAKELTKCDTEVYEETDLAQKAAHILEDLLRKELKLRDGMLTPDTEFYELGLDSISVTQLNVKMKEIFPELPATLFFTYKSVDSMADYLAEHYEMELKQYGHHAMVVQTQNKSMVESKPEKVEERIEISPCSEKAAKETNTEPVEIAIVGLSGRYPMAQDVEQFWDNLSNGRDCISEIPKDRWDYHDYGELEEGKKKGMYCKWGGFLDKMEQFDPQFFHISPTEARFMDPQERLFLEASWACVEDAGYTSETLKKKYGSEESCPVGVFAGVTFNNYQLYAVEGNQEKKLPVNSQIFSVANRVSYLMNFNGPSLSVDTACSSSLYAVHLACESIRRGECEAALAGGVNLSLHPSKYVTLCEGMFLASDGRCHTFGDGGDGYVPGEGVGVIMLESLAKAKENGDHIYGVIKGSAVNHDGKTYGFSVPNPVAQARVIEAALNQAHINPETVSYIEAHGTGTNLGDPIEIQGLTEAYRKYTDKKKYCAIGSSKSNIGHLEAAAGISQITKVLLQMKYHTIVPSLLHSDRLNPNIDFEQTPFYVPTKSQTWNPQIELDNGEFRKIPRRAGISSFGVGGVNVHIVLEDYETEPDNNRREDTEEEIVISAETKESLDRYVAAMKDYFKREKNNSSLADIAYTLRYGRKQMKYRICFKASGWQECMKRLDEYSESGRYLEILEKAYYLSPNELEKAGKHKVSLPTYPFEEEAYWIVDRTSYRKETGMESNVINHVPNSVEKKEDAKEVKMTERLKQALKGERLQIVMDDIRQMAAEILEFIPPKLPDVKQGFFDMGVDSILSARLYTRIEEHYGLELHATAVFDYPTIEKLAAYVLEQTGMDEPEEQTDDSDTNDRFETIYYTTKWLEEEKEVKEASWNKLMRVLLIASDSETAAPFAEELREAGCEYVIAISGKEYKKEAGFYEIVPEDEETYRNLLKDISLQHGIPTHIIHALATDSSQPDNLIEESCLDTSFYSMLSLCKALMQQGVKESVRLLYLYPFEKQAQKPFHEGTNAFAKSMLYENSNIVCTTLGVEQEIWKERTVIVRNVLLADEFACRNLRYTSEARLEKKNIRVNVKESEEKKCSIKNNAVYLITGGTGGLGTIFTDYLTRCANVTLVLTGRKKQNEMIEKQLKKIEEAGSKAIYVSCDVSRLEDVAALKKTLEEKQLLLDGIIHAAGVLRDSYILKKKRSEAEAVLSVKMDGVQNLDQVFAESRLDFFMVFSSLAAVDGSAGQCDYAYANYFMEEYMRYRNRLGRAGKRTGRSIAVNWPIWKQGGMKVSAEMEETMKRRIGLLLLQTQEGIRAFEEALITPYEQLGIVKADWNRLSRLMEILPAEENDMDEIPEEILDMDVDEVMSELEGLLGELE